MSEKKDKLHEYLMMMLIDGGREFKWDDFYDRHRPEFEHIDKLENSFQENWIRDNKDPSVWNLTFYRVVYAVHDLRNTDDVKTYDTVTITDAGLKFIQEYQGGTKKD